MRQENKAHHASSAAKSKGKVPAKVRGTSVKKIDGKNVRRKLSKEGARVRQQSQNRAKNLIKSTPKYVAILALSDGLDARVVWDQLSAATNCAKIRLPEIATQSAVHVFQGQGYIPIFPDIPRTELDIMDCMDSLIHADFFLFVVHAEGVSYMGRMVIQACHALHFNQHQVVLGLTTSAAVSHALDKAFTATFNMVGGSDNAFTSLGTQNISGTAPPLSGISTQQKKLIRELFHPDAHVIAPYDVSRHGDSLMRYLSNTVVSIEQNRPGWINKRPVIPVIGYEFREIDAETQAVRFDIVGWLSGQLPLTANQNAYLQSVGTCKILNIDTINVLNPAFLCDDRYATYVRPFQHLQVRSEDAEGCEQRSGVAAKETVIQTIMDAMRAEEASDGYDTLDATVQALANEEETDMIDEEKIQMGSDYDRKLQYQSDEPWEYPDELDIHPAFELRTLLKGWRGLKSMRTSPWRIASEEVPDGFEGLHHIHQPVQFYEYVKRQQVMGGLTAPGNFLRVTLEFVSSSHSHLISAGISDEFAPNLEAIYNQYREFLSVLMERVTENRIVGLCGLYSCENKDSVAHATMNLYGLPSTFGIPDAPPIKLGEEQPLTHEHPFVLYVGFRRIYTVPLPSQTLTPMRSKLQRYYRTQEPSITLSFICPMFVDYQNLPPVLAFVNKSVSLGYCSIKEDFRLCGSGKLTSFDTSFITLQRIVLAGTPFHISKHRIVVRHMFFYPEDVKYFAPVDLYTESNIRGRITQSIGLKGYFKAFFDGKVDHSMAIKMAVYRQAFPTLVSLRFDAGDMLLFEHVAEFFMRRIAATQEELARLAAAPGGDE